ncbi:MAG: hypothetical protein HFK04_00330 [Oscillospiraceae bacterium]|nr:hypothetical protein [Oscillospiraceae bacterium]
MIRKKRIWVFAKYFFYSLLLVIFYAMQTTAGVFSFFGVRPLWVVPIAVSIAMCENILPAAVFGAVSGLLCDLGSQALFGFNGLVMLCGCTAIALLSFFLVKVSWKSALLLGGGLAAIRALVEFFFFYLIWGYENIQLVFIHFVFPTFLYTALLTPFFLLLIQKMKEKCDGQWKE